MSEIRLERVDRAQGHQNIEGQASKVFPSMLASFPASMVNQKTN
jgi:hypothetical protein